MHIHAYLCIQNHFIYTHGFSIIEIIFGNTREILDIDDVNQCHFEHRFLDSKIDHRLSA